jgi:hypothetical protein
MGRVLIIIVGLTMFLIGVQGLTEEINNLVNLQENIIKSMGDN